MNEQPKDGGAAWVDATSYNRDMKELIPNAWRLVFEGVTLWVGTGNIYQPGKWAMTCRAVDIEAKAIGPLTMTPQEAQNKAAAIVSKALRARADEFVSAADAMIAAREATQ